MTLRRGSPERIDSVLERLIKGWKVLDKKEETIRIKIESIVGKNLSNEVSVQKNRGNKLTVLVNSSTLYHELSVYKKNEITESLKEDGVRTVNFRLVTDA